MLSKKTPHNIQNDLEDIYQKLLTKIGEDTRRTGLLETPKRAASAIQYLTKGYSYNVADIINGAIFESDIDEMIVVKDIELYSLCEHHLLPFFGKCHIGYIPRGKIIGLSKVARIVDVFARRLQVQENLTKQIAETLMKYTGAVGVGVIIEAKHLCMMMRGVEKQNAKTVTSAMLGVFKTDHKARAEFLDLLRQDRN